MFQYYPVPDHDFKFELNKDFVVATAHFIDTEEAGKCRNIHGHNYTINVTIVGNTLDNSGFLVNFSELKKAISDKYDHKLLNDIVGFRDGTPSTERFAQRIMQDVYEVLKEKWNEPKCLQVLVRETETSYVRYVDRRLAK